MISNLKPYPAYKDSGVRWLGKVPEHWEVMPVKRALRPQSCGNAAIKNTAVATPLDGYAPAFSASGQDVWLPRALHRGSALVLSAVGARCGKTFRADGEWGVVANTHILWPRAGQNRDYWWYVTNNEAWWDKAGAAQPFVRVSATLERSWVIPPLPEQTAIVRFLDYMDRRIRRSIRAKQKLIKLLEEYRQALIHQAVTGKIDVRTGKPYCAYKDSGVPWLGKVPEHWETCRLKSRLVKNDSGIWHEHHDPFGTIVLRSTEQTVSGGWKIVNPARLQLSDVERKIYLLQVGDLVVTKSSGSPNHIGKTSLVTEDVAALGCAFSNFMQRLRLGENTDPKLVWYYLNSPMGREQLVFQSTTTTGLGNLNGKILGSCIIALPPLPEQTAIVECLDAQTAKLDAAIAAARRKIELLREYRERLIADVVTGKVDVRQVAAQLPEEPPDQEAGTEEEEPVAEELATVDSQEEANGEE